LEEETEHPTGGGMDTDSSCGMEDDEDDEDEIFGDFLN